MNAKNRLTRKSIAIVGAGPTAIYAIQALIEKARVPCCVQVFEQQRSAGRGTPYRPGWNDPAMLSNIPSVELPPIGKPLVDWLQVQPAEKLSRYGIDRCKIDDRAFYPRLLLGDYMKDGFDRLLEQARDRGIGIEVCTGCVITDVMNDGERITLKVEQKGMPQTSQAFDYVVLATGHQWPEHSEIKPGYFSSPWPASALQRIGAVQVGIRGASLTAIDAVVALATRHGAFQERSSNELVFLPAPNSEHFKMTMMSRKGLLPEADFYGEIPYAPLEICTAEAVNALVNARSDKLLDQVFALFKRQLEFSDSDYAQTIELKDLSLEDFHDRYFAERLQHDPFDWAEKNLREAQTNYRDRFTVPWRYAILRMHEAIEPLIPHLVDEDYERFTRYFKPVFIDDYATIPHLSIKRILALHESGKLELMAIGDDYRIDSSIPAPGADIVLGAERHHFAAFIDATGQRALSAKDFPFPSLVAHGDVQDVADTDTGPKRGIAIDDRFHPVSRTGADDRLFCLSLPFILGTHPFHQGLTSAHEMGEEVGQELARMLEIGAKS